LRTPCATINPGTSTKSPERCRRRSALSCQPDPKNESSVLRFLTDEQISPAVASQAPKHCRGIGIIAMRDWQGGHFLGAPDELVLREAFQQRLTLVTFDLRTIPPLLRSWTGQGVDHGGVALLDERTIAQNDIGGLIASLCALWKTQGELDWTNRVVFI
jgi:hypothetical protein